MTGFMQPELGFLSVWLFLFKEMLSYKNITILNMYQKKLDEKQRLIARRILAMILE